ncbi:precorrin-6Y C5,15-methyltransferase (decarboxylating) subunit CbiT [Desulfolucanica intricata]|uniref:precorrin-6Y C5,15-methyltransferase (decarboxylating) subunit CbiT n=1 Tax=Desulfolucanica intricata TaxID=1285191 RepID=UPI000831E8FB|nr:precorrin-6Y C5,15-methyltransferase (decarboxylating) subunit CbiT [Desulfolucanica intricata]
MNNNWPFKTPGIPDDMFIRGSVPMTKEEVRALAMSKARLTSGQTVWDVGAGTGSLSIEAALQVPKGKVYAIERVSEGIKLIKQNKEKFSLDNIEIVYGSAPEVLSNLPNPDRVFIGGSGGHLKEILQLLAQKLLPLGRIIIMAITLETPAQAVEILQALKFKIEISQFFVARAVGINNLHLMKGLNPVYIITAEKGGN